VYSRETPPLVRAVRGMRLRGKRGVFTLPLGRSTVGRAPDVTVRIDSREISRVHAVILVEPLGASVEDQGSANGTTVNGKAARGVQPLADGDRVAFGGFEFAIELLRTGGAE
jgi:pSer/pThr/pTyr-binding forkhead associated (FHA) protein